MKLSIITLALKQRQPIRHQLELAVRRQAEGLPVEHIIEEDSGELPNGEKLARAFRRARGEYVCCLDDDDTISDTYVKDLLAGIDTGPDVVTFRLRKGTELWTLHANVVDQRTNNGLMSANHLCAWKREFWHLVPWYPITYGADQLWYKTLQIAFPLVQEYHVPRIIYEYRYKGTRTVAQNQENVDKVMERYPYGFTVWRDIHNQIVVAPNPGPSVGFPTGTVLVATADGMEVKRLGDLTYLGPVSIS